jgi:hypothetical protein
MAVVIDGLSFIGNFAAISPASPGRRLAALAALPAMPGYFAAAFLGIGHAPDAFPTRGYVAPYANSPISVADTSQMRQHGATMLAALGNIAEGFA